MYATDKRSPITAAVTWCCMLLTSLALVACGGSGGGGGGGGSTSGGTTSTTSSPLGGGGTGGGTTGLSGGGTGGGVTGTGVTLGGAQDMELVRDLIRADTIPHPDNYTYEGLYSEYDLPADIGHSGSNLLKAGVVQAYEGDDALNPHGLFLHLSLASNQATVDAIMQQDVDLSIVVDISGSMMSSFGDGGPSKIELTKEALRRLLDRLDEDDRLGIVLFNSAARVLLPPSRVSDKSSILQAIDTISAGGATSIESGIELGLQQFDTPHQSSNAISTRMILLTDAMPNVGNTAPQGFKTQMEAASAEGIGLTVLGVGLDQDFSLANFMSNMRGGNYRNLVDTEDMRSMFDSVDIDYLMRPIAHDFSVEVLMHEEASLINAFGLPGHDNSERTLLSADSLFLSTRRGAILLQVSDRCWLDAEIATLVLRYTTLDGTAVEDRQDVIYRGPDTVELDEPTSFFNGNGTRLTILLTRYLNSMKEACRLHHADESGGPELLERLIPQMESENAILQSSQIETEIDIAKRLWALMSGTSWPPVTTSN